MTAALLGDPELRDTALLSFGMHLRAQLGVTIIKTPLPDDTVGIYENRTRTLRVRATVDPDDELWLLHQAILHLTVGAHATAGRPGRPQLRLVPDH